MTDLWNDETGASTAEYAIVTLAAVAIAGVLVAVMRSGAVQSLLQTLIESALRAP
jgi:Flp pilus assembly pilin Flp